MRIAIVGAGIVGVTTAHELAADGHDLTVFERRGSVAEEASFAHAGLIGVGAALDWGAPGRPARGGGALGPLASIWSSRRAAPVATPAASPHPLQALTALSRERLQQLTRSLALDFERAEGSLVLLRTARDLKQAQPLLDRLAALQWRFDVLDADQCRGIEAGLNPATPLHAGIHLPDDGVGNCRQFAHLMRQAAEQLGVRFAFHTRVEAIEPGRRPQLRHVAVPPDDPRPGAATAPPTPVTESFDAIVVCAAMGAAELLHPHGVPLPLQAVHGHSLTAPLRHDDHQPDRSPRSAVLDERQEISISRLGGRVRVSGGNRLGAASSRPDAQTVAKLYKVLDDWFPGSARLDTVQLWNGARPTLPDGRPALGRSSADGVWVNLGHGGLGWGLACGCARVLADAMAGRPPLIDTDGLGPDRFAG